jgi:TP901 family phage tail tape measure protein
MSVASDLSSLSGGGLGNLYVSLSADSSQLIAGLKQAETAVIGSSAAMLKAVTVMGAGVTGALVAVGVVSIVEFAKFNKALTGSLAVMGNLSQATKQQMEDVARTISTNTTASAVDLAKNYAVLARSGMDANETMQVLGTTALLAEAGMVSLKEATTAVVEVQAAFGLSSKDAATNLENVTRIADMLAKASTMANASIGELGSALSGRTGIALRETGKDLEEGTAALIAFSRQGLEVASAGEVLTAVLRTLQTAAIGNHQVFKDMGVTVFDDAGKMKSLSSIIGDMQTAFKGASTEQERTVLGMMGFESRSVLAIQALMETKSSLGDYETALRSAGGTTEKMAETQLTSLSSQLTITENLFKDLLLTIGEGLAPAITELNEMLQNLLKTNSASNESFKVLVATIGGTLVDVVKGLAYAFGGLRDLLGVVLLGFFKLGEELYNLELILLGFADLIITHVTQAITDAFNGMIETVNDVIYFLPQTIKDKLGIGPMQEVSNSLGNFWTPFKEKAEDAIKYAIAFAKSGQDMGRAMATPAIAGIEATKSIDGLTNSFTKMGNAVQQSAKQVVAGINLSQQAIDSLKVTELMKLLGQPETPLTKNTAAMPTAAGLMNSMSVSGKTADVTQTEAMLKAAGLTGAGGGTSGAGQFLDPSLQQQAAIQKEIKANQDKLKILTALGTEEYQLTEAVQKRKTEAITAYTHQLSQLQAAQKQAVVQAGQQMFDALGDAVAGFAGKQSTAYSAMFAVSKAFAIASSVIKIQQGIAEALSLPFPSNLVAEASVITAAANIVSSIQSVKLQFAGAAARGGPVAAGSTYLVGERGPEAFTPSQSGTITPNSALGGGGTQVNVYNQTDATATVNESTQGDKKTIDVFIRKIKSDISAEIRDGRGDINRSLTSTFGLSRGK